MMNVATALPNDRFFVTIFQYEKNGSSKKIEASIDATLKYQTHFSVGTFSQIRLKKPANASVLIALRHKMRDGWCGGEWLYADGRI